MTEKELNQLYWLTIEMEKLKEEISQKENEDLYKSPLITGMPRGGKREDKFSAYAADMDNLRKLMAAALEKIGKERTRLEEYVNKMEDSRARLIVRLRHIKGMTWEQIGYELNYSEGNIRRLYKGIFKEDRKKREKRCG